MPTAAVGGSPAATAWRTASAVEARGDDLRARQLRAQEARALGAGLRVRDDRLDRVEPERAPGEQAEMDRVPQLADDHDVVGLERERVERRVDRALERVLDRHQRTIDRPVVDGDDRVVERRLRDELEGVGARDRHSASWLTVPSGPR